MGMAAAFSTQPRRAALTPSRKELEISARDNALAGDSCRLAAPASCCKVSCCKVLACSRAPAAACPPCSEPAARGQPGGWGPCSPAARSLVVGRDPAAGAARRFPGQGRQGSEKQPSQAEVRLVMALGAFLGAQGEPQRVSRPEIILLLH